MASLISTLQRFYQKDIVRFLKYCIPQGSSLLHVGCENTLFLEAVKASESVALTWTEDRARELRQENPNYQYYCLQADCSQLDRTFDFIVLSDVLGLIEDVDDFLKRLIRYSNRQTRIIVTHYSRLWQPLFRFFEFFTKDKSLLEENWIGYHDVVVFLYLSEWEMVKCDKRMLLPLHLPLLSSFCNRFLVHLPLIRHLALYNAIVARPRVIKWEKPSVSVVIPARNEKGNIENAIKRIPKMAEMEIIFVEGGSDDGTWQEMQRVKEKYPDRRILLARQDGKGKGNAVRKGFSMATCDIVTILDADLTMPPEELPKYYHALVSGLAEFANGCRLVYPLEKGSMRFFNIIGNHFFSTMFSWLLDQRIKDSLCGTKMMFRHDYEKLVANRDYFGNFDPFGDFDLIFGAAKLNLKIVDIPIHYKSREYGETNISRWKHGIILLWMMLFAMRKIKFI